MRHVAQDRLRAPSRSARCRLVRCALAGDHLQERVRFSQSGYVCSDFSNRRCKRVLSSRKRRISAPSGFVGRPRRGFVSELALSCLRQLERSELYTPQRRMIAARASGDEAASYSAMIRALSSALKTRCFGRGRTSGSVAIKVLPWSPSQNYPGCTGLIYHRHRGHLERTATRAIYPFRCKLPDSETRSGAILYAAACTASRIQRKWRWWRRRCIRPMD